MKRTVVFLGMVCMATSAMAFGGGGSGHDSARYNRHNPGVDNFGVHIHPDNPPLDIRFYDIKDDANAQPCQEGANVYCCKEGYVVDVATSKCVACPSGSVASLEENFQCTLCSDIEQPDEENAVCEQIEPIVTLTQTLDESTFFYKQPSFVNGTLTEVGHGSWKAIATDGELVTIDYTLDSNGNIQETIWYPDNKQEIEETPLKQGDFFSFLKHVFVKKAYANTSDRKGLNTEEWKQFALRLDCDGVTSSWRNCFCVGTLALQDGKYVCTCPDGGVLSGRDCCKDGYSYNKDTKKYDTVSTESATVCGCPSGTTKVQHMFCCDTQGNAVWGIDKKEQFPICFSQIACPNGLTPNLTTGVCECPNGGSLGTDGQTCCLSGYVYKGVEECSNLYLPGPDAQEMARKGYCTLNIPVCGCDTTHTTEPSDTGKGCCFSGYYDDGSRDFWSFDWNNVTECNGCGYGQLVEKDGQKYCCGEGEGTGWAIGPYDISDCNNIDADGVPNCTSPASTGAAQTQVCCEETSGMKWCASNNTCVYEQASCPCTDTGNGCQKCEDGTLVADETLNGQACGAGGVCASGECAVCDANHLDLCQSETECTTAQGKWCASNNTCIDDTESCQCAGEQPACHKCEDGEWVADEECLCEADDGVWDTSKQDCCPYGFWLEYENIEENGAACCDQFYNWYSYYTNQPTEDCCHAMTYYGVWDEDNQLCCSVSVDAGNLGYDAYQHKPTEACCNFVGGGWDSDMQNCCPRDAWVEDAQACCLGVESYFTNELTEACCKNISGKWDNTGKTCCETAEGSYFGADSRNGQKTEACCNVVGGNWSNGDCTPKTSQ